jgi:hypothetical protein
LISYEIDCAILIFWQKKGRIGRKTGEQEGESGLETTIPGLGGCKKKSEGRDRYRRLAIDLLFSWLFATVQGMDGFVLKPYNPRPPGDLTLWVIMAYKNGMDLGRFYGFAHQRSTTC